MPFPVNNVHLEKCSVAFQLRSAVLWLLCFAASRAKALGVRAAIRPLRAASMSASLELAGAHPEQNFWRPLIDVPHSLHSVGGWGPVKLKERRCEAHYKLAADGTF